VTPKSAMYSNIVSGVQDPLLFGGEDAVFGLSW